MTVLRAFGLSVRLRTRTAVTCVAAVAAGLLVAVLGIRFGDPAVPFGTTVAALAGRADFADTFIVVQLGLPRAVTALLVGAALGASGAIFQSVSRNPLGSPDVIGFNVGAATGAIVTSLYVSDRPYGTGVAAVGAGLVTALAVYLFAWRRGMRGYRLVLVGVGVSAVLTSVNAALLAKAALLNADDANLWLYGSLNAVTWTHAAAVAAALAVLLPAAAAYGRRMDLLEMGDETATALGVPVERSRVVLVVLGTALAAVAVAAVGPVSFVALAAPQLVRRLTRAPGHHLLPAACMGAALLVAADVVAQHALPGAHLPVGLATGALGGGYLAWLLAREWRSGRMRA